MAKRSGGFLAVALTLCVAGFAPAAAGQGAGSDSKQAGEPASKQNPRAERPSRTPRPEDPGQYQRPAGLDRGVFEFAERDWRALAAAVSSLASRSPEDPMVLTPKQAKVFSAAQVAVDAKVRNWALSYDDQLEKLREEAELIDRRLGRNEVAKRREKAQKAIDNIMKKKPNHDYESSQIWRTLSPDQRSAVMWDLATDDALLAPVMAPQVEGKNPRRVLIQGYLDDITTMSEQRDETDVAGARLPGELKEQLLAVDQPTREMAIDVIEARLRHQMAVLPRGGQLMRDRDGGPSMK